jgi:four helix bundle protein
LREIGIATIEQSEDIEAWQKGRELCRVIYSATNGSRSGRDYGLCDQVRRASVSIVSNIAEGFEGQNNKTFAQYLYITRASSGEVRSQAYVAPDQDYTTQDTFDEVYTLCKDIARLLTSFITCLEHTLTDNRRLITGN